MKDTGKRKRGERVNNSKEETLIAALLTSPTVKAASAATEIPESTIYSYLRKPDFKKRYREAKADVVHQATTYLQGKTAEILEVITEIANNKEIHPQTRLTACRTLLEYSLKFTETSDIVEQIQELKAEFDEETGNI